MIATAPLLLQMPEAVGALDWSADGPYLAAGDLSGNVAVSETPPHAPGQETILRLTHPGGVTALAWHPHEALLASGGLDGTVQLWRPGVRLGVRADLASWIGALRWSPDGRHLAVAAGTSVHLLDRSGRDVATFAWLPGAVHDVAWLPGPAPLAAGTHGGIAWLDPGAGADPVELWAVRGAAMVLAPDGEGRRLASGDLAGVVRVAETVTGREVSLSGWQQRIEGLSWTGSGRRLAVIGGDEITVWRFRGLDTDEEPVRLWRHDDRVTVCAYGGPDGSLLATGGADGLVVLWSPDRLHDPVARPLGAAISRLAWRPGGDLLAVGTAAGQVVVEPPSPER